MFTRLTPCCLLYGMNELNPRTTVCVITEFYMVPLLHTEPPLVLEKEIIG